MKDVASEKSRKSDDSRFSLRQGFKAALLWGGGTWLCATVTTLTFFGGRALLVQRTQVEHGDDLALFPALLVVYAYAGYVVAWAGFAAWAFRPGARFASCLAFVSLVTIVLNAGLMQSKSTSAIGTLTLLMVPVLASGVVIAYSRAQAGRGAE